MPKDLVSRILDKKKNIGRPGLLVTLSRIKKRLDLKSTEQAASYYIKRHGLDINVSSVIDDVTRRAVQSNLTGNNQNPNQLTTRRKKKWRATMIQNTAADPFIDDRILNAAYSNAEVYPAVYVFENSVRRFVSAVMSKYFGTDWWVTKVNPRIQQAVEIRRLAEKQTPWHSKRGAEPIYYTDIEDLEKIINTYSGEFRQILTNFEHVIVWIDEIEKTRNILAHNNLAGKKDKERLLLFAHDWSKCTRPVYEKIL